jgi:hypothetical protein
MPQKGVHLYDEHLVYNKVVQMKDSAICSITLAIILVVPYCLSNLNLLFLILFL